MQQTTKNIRGEFSLKILLIDQLNLKTINQVQFSSQQMQVLNDPDCIPFMLKKHISLPLLKHEIDRRILKITTLLKRSKAPNQQPNSRSFQDQYVQTENFQAQPALASFPCEDSNILCPSKTYDPNQNYQEVYKLRIKKSPKKPQYLPTESNSKRKMGHKQSSSQMRFLTSQTQNQQSSVQHNRFTFRGNISSHKSAHRGHQNQQEGESDHIFQKIDFATEISSISHGNHKNKSPYYSDQYNDYLKNQETLMSFHTDFSGSDRAKMDPIQRRKNTRRTKIQSKDLTVSEADIRIAVSSQCLQRMKASVEGLVQHRRKELLDSKVRQNMLKKIEQRYGELNSN